MDSPTWVMAGFTGVLVVFTGLLFFVTRRYTKVTEKLLKQSETAFKQSRTAFLLDVIDRTMDYVMQYTSDIGTTGTTNYFIGKIAAIRHMDEKAADEIMEAFRAWGIATKQKKEFFDQLDEYEESSKKKLS